MDPDHEELLRAVEKVASLLAESGIPVMAARVFAYALAEDADHYTAAELAEGLRISPAAVSGAVRYLTKTGLLFKERRPGQRAVVYRIDEDDVWSTIITARVPMLEVWERGAREAAEMVGPKTRGGRRLTETEAFCRFWREDTVHQLARWQAYRRELLDVES